MKTLIIIFFSFFCSNVLFSQFSLNSNVWEEVPLASNTAVDYISHQDGVVYFAQAGKVKKRVHNLEYLVWDFGQPVRVWGVFPTTNNLIIVTDSGAYRQTQNQLDTLYKIPGWTSGIPLTYQMRGSFSWKGKIILLVSSTAIYSYRTYLLQLRLFNRGLDTVYISAPNSYAGTDVVFEERNKNQIIVSGFAFSSIFYPTKRIERLQWTGATFQLLNYEDRVRERGQFISSAIFWSSTLNTYGFTEITKSIQWGNQEDEYFYHHDAYYVSGHGGSGYWVPEVTKGVDFQGQSGLQINNHILFCGPIALDRDNNISSVRLYSLETRNFTKEYTLTGTDLLPITVIQSTLNQHKSTDPFIVIGSEGKLYFRSTARRENSYLLSDSQSDLVLMNNFPNPFNPTTVITYVVKTQGLVRLAIYDVRGREVEVVVNEIKPPGNYQIRFDGSKCSSGVYFYGLQGQKELKKMILIK